MTQIGARFKTGDVCPASGDYAFDGYVDGSQSPAPTANERVIPMKLRDPFPPLRSSNKGCYWKVQRLG